MKWSEISWRLADWCCPGESGKLKALDISLGQEGAQLISAPGCWMSGLTDEGRVRTNTGASQLYHDALHAGFT